MNASIEAETFKNITPFAITSYKYSPSNLEQADFEKIYQAILNYLQTKTYNDPMIGSSKYANQKTKIATSKRSKYAVPQNISYRNGEFPEAATILTNGADDVPESIQRYRNNNIKLQYKMNKNRIRLTESQLRQIVKESVDSILKKGSKKKDPMSQWFNDFNKASKYRETMDYVNKGGRNPLSKKKEDNEVSETYNKLNGLHRLAYENQGMKEKIKEVAQFADIVAEVAHSEGRDNYAKFYKPLASNIFQMLNLWGFLDNIDD